MNNNNNGWIKIHRSIIEWEWWSDRNTRDLFLYCLLAANHTDTKWRGITVNRGQLITTLSALAEKCGLSIRQTRTALSNLQATHETTQQTTHKYTIITICNYDKYQGDKDDSDTANDTANDTASDTQATHERHTDNTQATHERHTDDTQTTHNKNVRMKEEKEEKEENFDDDVKACAYACEGEGNTAYATATSHRMMADNLSNGGQMMESLMRIHGISQEDLIREEGEFYDRMLAIGEGNKDFADYRRHFNDWLRKKREYKAANATMPAPEGVALGIGEYITPDGRRTYADGRVTIPMTAPRRPSSQYCWDSANQRWINL